MVDTLQSPLYTGQATPHGQHQHTNIQGYSEDGTFSHELISCSGNDGVGIRLIRQLQHHVPGLSVEAALSLEHGDLDAETSLQVSLLTAINLHHIWKEQETGTKIRGYKVRAELEQYITF